MHIQFKQAWPSKYPPLLLFELRMRYLFWVVIRRVWVQICIRNVWRSAPPSPKEKIVVPSPIFFNKKHVNPLTWFNCLYLCVLGYLQRILINTYEKTFWREFLKFCVLDSIPLFLFMEAIEKCLLCNGHQCCLFPSYLIFEVVRTWFFI